MTTPARGSKPWSLAAVGALYLAVVALLRLPTFFHSYENWDESLFLLMARSLLDGHPLYVDIWDHKPPGVFVAFAAAQALFGRSVLSIRILACLLVTASSLLLFVIGRRLRSPLAGLVAGLLYAAFSMDYGRPTNLELVFAPLVIAAFALALAHEPEDLLATTGSPIAIGLLAGLALQVSYVALFDVAALGALLLGLVLTAWPRPPLARVARFFALAAAGPLGMLAATALAFAATGHFGDYVHANFASNARYVSDTGLDVGKLAWMIERRVRESFPLWLALGLAPLCLLTMPDLPQPTRRGLAGGLVWAAGALGGVVATRHLFAHYFLDPLPAQCLLCALVVSIAAEDGAAARRSPARLAIVLALVLLGPVLRAVEKPLRDGALLVRKRCIERIPYWGDEPAAIAAYLRPRITADDALYVADYQPIVHYLVPARIPTRFVFPPFLIDERQRALAGGDADAEVRAIFAKRPLYVLKAGEAPSAFYRLLREELERGYDRETTIGAVEIYRRRD